MYRCIINLLYITLIFNYSTFGYHGFRIFKVINQSEPNIYILRRSKLSLIPDIPTLNFLGFSLNLLKSISILNAFKKVNHIDFQGIIESCVLKIVNPDEIMKIFSIKFKVLQDHNHLIKNLRYVDKVWNPSVEKLKGFDKLLIVARNVHGSEINFGWLNNSDNPSALQTKHMGIGPGLSQFDNRPIIIGSDARILIINENEILMCFCVTPYLKAPTRMAITYLKTFDINSKIVFNVSETYMLEPTFQNTSIAFSVFGRANEAYHKNWSPYVYNSTIYWLASIDPLMIVRITPNSNKIIDGIKTLETEIVYVNELNNYWRREYGDMRGGTPGKLIGKHQYLFFFHSRQKLGYGQSFNSAWTYMMGAFTISSSPPFEMTSISRVPIFHRDFYVGPWDYLKFMDYVVYPMSYYLNDNIDMIDFECDLKCFHRYNITLVFGYQDVKGILATINLGELFNTMIPINKTKWPDLDDYDL